MLASAPGLEKDAGLHGGNGILARLPIPMNTFAGGYGVQTIVVHLLR